MTRPAFVCPRCHGALGVDAAAYTCAPCVATYPIILGIPDFRVLADPWISLEDDRAKAMRLAADTADRSFEETVRAYWAMTPGTPSWLAERFIAHVMGAEERTAEWLRDIPAPSVAGEWLDVGCGTGDLLAVARSHGAEAVGVDIALRWLVVARKRPSLAGWDDRLVCCDAEHLPFASGSFARVVSLGTLEHCIRSDDVIAESHRVIAAGGDTHLKTVNRYTLLRESHVHVWGVGFVPRRWSDRYVQWRNGERYLHHRPLSVRELRRGLRQAGFADVRVGPAPLLGSEAAQLGALRALAPVYESARALPFVKNALGWVAPQLQAHGVVA